MSRFRFVEDHQRAVSVKRPCQVLRVSRSRFCRCRSAAPARAARQAAEDRLVERISTIHAESSGAYGAPRVHAELRSVGEPVNRNRYARPSATASVRRDDARRRGCCVGGRVAAAPCTPVSGYCHRCLLQAHDSPATQL